ncbi:MAG: FAD-dependent oxidoreductase [Actinomycetota bacterium]|nr:FAD-dependent oxidoreductase [Actinomycetota bacterium]
MPAPGIPKNHLRVAIVGSGPAGFYAAEHLLKQTDHAVRVDMFDRLPTPFGLVRAGVAPDHPKIKSVTRMYEKTAARDGYRFFGNVLVGRDVTPAELARHYHAVIYAYGSATDRSLGIPGEDLPGSHPATEFVAWYNAHPDFSDREFDLSARRVVVIGNGNVAADVARMLALTRAELEETDVADHAIDPLADSGVEEIVLVGRRGPAQAAFTNPEVRELGEMLDADIVVDPAEVALDEVSREYLESEDADPTNRRNVEIFSDFAGRKPTGKRRRIVMRFFSSPVEIKGDGKVQSIVIGRNRLERTVDGRVRAVDTGEREQLDCGLVLRSIGYRGEGIDGLVFDVASGTIPNDHGRMLDPGSGAPVPGTYAVGWIKRGPSGVIGTNKKDAQDTVDALLEDVAAGRIPGGASEIDPGAIERLVADRQPDYVTFSGWRAIDEAEVARGEPLGRPRVKFCSIEEMVATARGRLDSSDG